jgi:CheY-like chemotaxis protein
MPCVLLVDDSPVDRRLIGGLMSKELDWLVEYASSGTEALKEMELALPDLVVTDLMMPEMDGLQLVSEVRRRYPHIPVILITAHGNETLAVEALETGAASYVPKSQIPAKLLNTARQVLSLNSTERTQEQLLACLSKTHCTFSLENDPAIIAPFVADVLSRVESMRLCDSSGIRHLAVALEEALLNAILHGNLQLTPDEVQLVRSDLMQGKDSAVLRQRRQQPELRNRRVDASYELTREQARFSVRDQGNGFDVSTTPVSGDPDPIDAEEGRGLVLIQNFMDEVRFNEHGNEITMVKHWKADHR